MKTRIILAILSLLLAPSVLWAQIDVPGVRSDHVVAEAQVEDADGAQTNALLVEGSGVQVVVTRVSVKCSNANTVDVTVVLGFGTATIPARAHTGVSGIVASFDEIPPGGGFAEYPAAVGATNDDLRLTMDDPVGGACVVNYTYYTF